MKLQVKNISVARDFSKFPGGRYYTDGPFSGEQFRKEILEPALDEAETLFVDLNGTRGYGSSFLDEAFGGLVRERKVSANDIATRIRFNSDDESYIEEIQEYTSGTYA